jgi:predicted lipoprotein with Yx(FWY)xxD motif
MKKPALLALGPVAAAVAIAGCGGGSSTPSSGATPSARSGASITLSHSKLGSFLTDGNGRTLYLFEADKTSASSCYSTCASLWPPLKSTGAVRTASPVLASELGTTKRTDGTTEVTYHGHPLYYYAGDSKPGDTTGQALNQFGAKWYVVSRNGSKIDTDGH